MVYCALAFLRLVEGPSNVDHRRGRVSLVMNSCPLICFLPTFHGVPTEGPVLSADHQRLLIVFAIVPSLERVQAIPLLDGDALWWRSLK
jgi:hypothetical protein